MEHSDPNIEEVLTWFSRIYLGGIPPMITDDSAFLSFVCVLTAIEALAGYRYSDVKEKGKRFKQFVTDYMPEPYRPHAGALWDFRNGMVHAFTTSSISLTHHHSECHLRVANGSVILNAEDFYGALLTASQKYFQQLRTTPQLQNLMVQRLQSPDGGSVTVGPLEFHPPTSQS
jgi:hypothetical protein